MAKRGPAFVQTQELPGTSTVETTRVAIAETRTLTGVETKSDAWGKIIPVTFGRTRVPGALVWASNYYKTTSGFDATTTQIDRYTQNVQFLQPAADVPFELNVGVEGTRTTSQIVRETVTSSAIDLCYSFGKEGDPRRKRFVDKMRINDVVVYDSKTNYVAPGLGFSVRYGYSADIDGVMAGYANGDLYYPGQTLVIFNKFPTASFGDKIPDRVDVEFGCILYEIPTPGGPCTLFARNIANRRADYVMVDNESTIEFNFVNPTMIVHHVFEQQPKTLPQTFDGYEVLTQAAVGNGVASIIYKQLTFAEITEFNMREKHTVKRNGVAIQNVASVTDIIEIFRNPFDGDYDVWPEDIFGFHRLEQLSGAVESQGVSGPGFASLGLMQNYPIARYANFNKDIGQSDMITGTPPNGDNGPYVYSLYTINSPCGTPI